MKYKHLLILASIVISNLSGCAFTDEQIDITYSQPVAASSIKGANKVSVKVQVSDQRADTSKVSSKKNGYGMETAKITAKDPVEKTVQDAIESELKTRGFQLGGSNALVNIKADLTRFYNDHKLGFFTADAKADFDLTVGVKSQDGDDLYTKNITAQGTEANNMMLGGDNAKLALENALQNGMQKLFNDRSFVAALLATAENKVDIETDADSEVKQEIKAPAKSKPRSKRRKN